MQQYRMKNLGYKRTPTAAWIRVTFSNGETWEVPAQAVADSRDENYRDEKEDTIGFIANRQLSPVTCSTG